MDFLAYIMSLRAQGMTAAQITEAVNEYLQDHPDALDQAAVEAILDGRLDVIDDELSSVKSAINSVPTLNNSDAEDTDLDIGDPDGNILVRMQNGHIKTKKFDSSSLGYVADSSHDDSNADLNIADTVGNVVLQIENGNVKTKRFNSLIIFPNIVTVKKDGTGDYTTLREAVESITDADAVSNPYVIEVYEGTYNVCDDYTQEEIESAGEEHYTNTSFVGLKITDGISIRGVGCRNNIVLYGYLDPNVYTQANRNNIATLNTQGECFLENITVIGENVRYAVHDDFSDSFYQIHGRNPRRTIKNCVFVSKSTTGNAAYGAGTSKARDYFIDNCVFDGGIGIHKATGMKQSGTMIFENCSGSSMSIGDYSRNATDAVHVLIVNNCAFKKISIYKSENQGYDGQHIKMYGTGSLGTLVDVPNGFVYKTGDIVTTSTQLSIGDVVDCNFNTGTYGTAYGICIGTYDGDTYVQCSGYIPVSLLSLSANVGDFVAVSNGTTVVSQSNTNAIGKVISSGSKLYIKLLI